MAEAICLILDVGASSVSRQLPVPGGDDGGNSRSFLDAGLECASLFLEKKLYQESKDEIGIVLFGTEDTQNNLDYDHVKVLERGFCTADWETISFLREHVKGTNVESDWMDALIVALDFIKTAREEKKYEALKLVLISDLGGESRLEDTELVIKGMKMLDNVDFTHIGSEQLTSHSDSDEYDKQNGENGDHHPDDDSQQPGPSSRGEKPKRSNLPKPLTKTQKLNQQVISEIVVETEGISVSLDEAVACFFYKNKKKKKPWPWKVVFEIGPDIRIGMTGYVKLRRETPKTWKRCLAESSGAAADPDVPGSSNNDVEELRPRTVFLRNNENQDVIDPQDTITSYTYGNELVTIGEADETACKFDGGPKSMCLFGFVNRDEIGMDILSGNGSMVFLPNEEDENSGVAVSVLAEALVEMGMVAIVRRVYSARTDPHLGVLAPEEDGQGGLYLVYSDLPFSEERRELQFPSLNNPRHPLSADQLQAVDDLIDVMDLEPEDDQGETVSQFNPEDELNPQYQYLYQTLTHRAFHPGQSLPQVPAEIVKRLSAPSSLATEANPVVEKLKSLFPTEKVEQKGKRTVDKVFGSTEEDENGPSQKRGRFDEDVERPKLVGQNESQDEEGEGERIIISVGSINPVQDFQYLLGHRSTTGATLQSAGSQLEEIILKFIASSFGSDLNLKIIQCLKVYRQACLDSGDPQLYNNFMKQMKIEAGHKLWSDVVQDGATGLLRRGEVEGGVEDEEAEAFFRQEDEVPEVQPQEDDDEDMEDLL